MPKLLQMKPRFTPESPAIIAELPDGHDLFDLVCAELPATAAAAIVGSGWADNFTIALSNLRDRIAWQEPPDVIYDFTGRVREYFVGLRISPEARERLIGLAHAKSQ